jgi:hypothetical protein
MTYECSPHVPRTPTEYEANNYRPGVPIYPVRTTIINAHKDCGARHKIGDTWEISGIYEGATRGFICPDQNTPVLFKIERLEGQPIYLASKKVYHGNIGFSLDRDVESTVQVGVQVRAAITVKEAAGKLLGKRLGRDWVVLNLDYKRRRKPKGKTKLE